MEQSTKFGAPQDMLCRPGRPSVRNISKRTKTTPHPQLDLFSPEVMPPENLHKIECRQKLQRSVYNLLLYKDKSVVFPKVKKRKCQIKSILAIAFIFLWIGFNVSYVKKSSIKSIFRIDTDGLDIIMTPEKTKVVLEKEWKGDTYGGNPGHFHRIFFVISHCDEALDWLEEFSIGVHVYKTIIYSKCNVNVRDAPQGSVVLRMPNVGRCDHSYAHWMANMPSTINDDDAVVFLKGNNEIKIHVRSRSLSEMLRIASVNGFGCWLEPTKAEHFSNLMDMSAYHDTEILLNYNIEGYLKQDRDKLESFETHFKNLREWLKSVNGSLPKPLTQVCYGGMFAVKASQIKMKGAVFWSKIENSLSRGNNIAEGHYAERSWAGLLSNPLAAYDAQALENNANIKYKNNTCYQGALVRNPIWNGNVNGGDPNHFRRIFLVISHCDESLNWLEEFTREFRVYRTTIYSKCDHFINDVPRDANVVRLPNVGRCDHTFAYWMASASMTSMVNDDDAVVFLKAGLEKINQTRSRSLSEMLRIASVNGFGCMLEPLKAKYSNDLVDMSAYHDTRSLETFDPRHLDGLANSGSQFKNLRDWLKSVNASLPINLTQVCYGSMFAAKASRIKKKGAMFWSRIEKSLSRRNNDAEFHYAERSWAGFLSNQLTTENLKAIHEYANEKFLKYPYYGALLHEKDEYFK